MSLMVLPVNAISENQKKVVGERCDAIQDVLRGVQRKDARTRVYLGEYYDAILEKFIKPLNVRLVENDLSSAELVENQNDFANTKTLFADDFVSYQQELEALVLVDCTKQPEEFVKALTKVRQKRKIVEQDVLQMRNLLSKHVKLANQLKGKL